MDYIVATSRGKQLVEHFRETGVPGKALPGGKLTDITKAAIQILRETGYDRRRDTMIYLIAGLPDVTIMLKGKGYQEVIGQIRDPEELANEAYAKFEMSAAEIIAAGATPIYATVTPIAFKKWNEHRLQQGRTSLLHFSSDYFEMQKCHEKTLELLNMHITALNRDMARTTTSLNGSLVTPRLASRVFKKVGEKRGYRFRQNLLVDGCHPVPEVVTQWIADLGEVMDTNRVQSGLDY